MGLYCVTTNLLNALQWSHYTNGHRGLCWIFSQSTPPLSQAVRVSYQDDYPVVDWANWQKNDLLKAALLTKSSYWSYEDEYRLLLPSGKWALSHPFVAHNGKGVAPRGRYLEIPRECLLGVVFGACMPLSHRARIAKLALDYGRAITFYAAGIHRRKYALVIDQISKADVKGLAAMA